MKKLSVFSKKLGKGMDLCFSEGGALVMENGASIYDSWMDNGWNNTDNWMDHGWNNTTNWTDHGWNNTGNWMDDGWNNTNSWMDNGSNDNTDSGGGCYLTTACVNHKGLADDCHELEVLRQYRDELVKEDETFREKVLEYYRKAPLIVQHIDQDQEKQIILEDLYQNMILPCVSLLEQGQKEEAKQLYLSSYEKLSEKYLEA